MGDNIFIIRGLSFSYGKHEILKDLDMDIPSGAVTTLIGANGCGKSTLFGLMTKNLKPASGEIKLAGCRISHMNIKEFAKQVAIVHQHNTAPADLSVEKLVSYGRTPYRSIGSPGDTEKDEEKINWAHGDHPYR